MMMAITTIQAKATENSTSIEHIGPANWGAMDPYHQHSGHVLVYGGLQLYIEIDLLNTQSPSIINSVSISLSVIIRSCESNLFDVGHTIQWHLVSLQPE